MLSILGEDEKRVLPPMDVIDWAADNISNHVALADIGWGRRKLLISHITSLNCFELQKRRTVCPEQCDILNLKGSEVHLCCSPDTKLLLGSELLEYREAWVVK